MGLSASALLLVASAAALLRVARERQAGKRLLQPAAGSGSREEIAAAAGLLHFRVSMAKLNLIKNFSKKDNIIGLYGE